MNYKLSLFFLLTISLFYSCEWVKEQEFKESPLCRVFDNYLYPSDLKGLISSSYSNEDSMRLIKRYVDRWVKQHLLLKLAKENMEVDKPSLKRKITDYTNTLIIYDYEQALLRQKLDTVLNDEEVLHYYNEFKHNFLSKKNWVRLTFIQINPKAPKLDSVRYWINDKKDESRYILEDYCNQYATQFTLDSSLWFDFALAMEKFPLKIYDVSNFLRYNKYTSVEDSLYRYFLKIHDYSLIGEVKPLMHVSKSIKKIIINKRKQAFIEKLHTNAISNANKKDYEILY